MKSMSRLAIATGAMAALPRLAEAHVSGMHGGLGAGMAHPLLGPDHLIAMLAVGMVAACGDKGRRWAPPAVFLAAMLAGACAGMAGLPFSLAEMMIAVSLVALGLLLVLRPRFVIAVPIIAVAGLAHGYAHGAEIPAAADGAVFMIGMLLTTAAIHASGLVVALLVQGRRGRLTRLVLPGIGTMMAASGVGLMIAGA